MKIKRLWLIGALILVLSFWLFRAGPEVVVEIPTGAGGSEVAQLLKESGVLRTAFLFKALAALTRLDRNIKPGIYHLRQDISSPEILWRLYWGGKVQFIKFTVPEGWRATQMAERLEALEITSEREFLRYVKDRKLEGYLFPTTYHLEKKMLAEQVAFIMHQEFQKKVLPHVRAANSRLNLHEIVTLASIVEREAEKSGEMPMIAAVYLNRLTKRRLLEADPTVQYSLGYWKQGLTFKDLKMVSPYNTYLFPGLPPGPICSPGLKSIFAVLNPAPIKALYFVADNRGGHTFHLTYEEHLKAKRKAKEELRRLKKEQNKKSAVRK